jgi:hypothetical protein
MLLSLDLATLAPRSWLHPWRVSDGPSDDLPDVADAGPGRLLFLLLGEAML